MELCCGEATDTRAGQIGLDGVITLLGIQIKVTGKQRLYLQGEVRRDGTAKASFSEKKMETSCLTEERVALLYSRRVYLPTV